MTTGVLILTMAAGGMGSALRYLVDNTIKTRLNSANRFPWGTTIINISGSLLLGLIVGSTTASPQVPTWATIVGTGLIGGYTTFSTAAVETTRLLQERRYRQAFASGVVTGAVCILAAGAGLVVARSLW